MSEHKQLCYIKGVGEKRAEILKNHGIADVSALLRYYPRKYLDFKNTVSVANAPFGLPCCIRAKVITEVKEHYIRKNMTIYKFTAVDSTGVLDITVFNNKYITKTVKNGEEYLFYGKVTGGFTEKQMSAPIIKPVTSKEILPIYPAISGITSYSLQQIIKNALNSVELEETLPIYILQKYNLCNINDAIRQIHFPTTQSMVNIARKRLAFEELLTLQLGMAMRKSLNNQKEGTVIKNDYSEEFQKFLPFNLTDSQKKVVAECIRDMQSGKPMARLVQGDVGSGKTAVAASLMYTVAKNNMQCVFMAPTEILAEQHFENLSNMFKGSFNIALLTSSVTKKNKQIIKQDLADGKIDIIVGTHAIIQDDVIFNNLGLVITDEQHRFGVKQRTTLVNKGANPHLLVMSATPIPRTLALIIYGELDISVINELPKGRQPVETYAVTTAYRNRFYKFIKDAVNSGRQAYIVCPLVEPGETDMGLMPAQDYAKHLSEKVFPEFSVGLLHGKMKSSEKEKVMREFSENKINILVATTVIEVGIDVKNATIMVIENAERFGLSQLHQLRGRIGRGREKSTCILVSDAQNKTSVDRLKTVCSTSDGFKIADQDLKLRGPGDFCGKRQHGLPELKIADLETDMELFRLSATVSNEIIKSDRTLKSYPALLKEVKQLYNTTKQYGQN